MNDIRDKEATCGNCPWATAIGTDEGVAFECWHVSAYRDERTYNEWCAQHPRNQLALRRWMEKQLQPGTFDVSEFYEDNIDYNAEETTQTPPGVVDREPPPLTIEEADLRKERDELREQLAQRDNDITGLKMKVQTLGVAGALLEKKLEEHGFWPCALCGTWERGDDFAAENAETGGRVCWDCAEGWTICERCDCTHPPDVPCPWCVIKEPKT
jgi:hypothetical protein